MSRTFFPPAGYIDRPRLTAAVASGARFVAITACAGSGKTTLLDSYELGLEARCIRMDARDRDADALLADLVRQIGGAETETALGADRGAQTQWLGEHFPPDVVLMIDDLDDAAFDGVLLRLTRDGVARVIVTSRRKGRFDELLLETAGTLLVDSDLWFTPSEATAHVRAVGGESAPSVCESVRPVYARLAGIASRNGQTSTNEWCEKFVSYLLELAPSWPGDFEKLAIPAKLPRELAGRLIHDEDVERAITQAQLIGLGTSDENDFTFYPAYADVLRGRLRRRSSEQYAAGWRVTSLWCLENGRPFEAFTCALEIQDYYLASRILRTRYDDLIRTNGSKTAPLLEELGPRVRTRFPVLAMGYAIELYRMGHRARAAAEFFSVVRGTQRTSADQDPVEQVWLRAMQTGALRLIGRFRASANTARDGLELSRKIDVATAEDIGETFEQLFAHFAISLFYAGDVPGALEAVRRGLELTPTSDLPWVHLQSMLAGIHALQGELREAELALETVHTSKYWRQYSTSYYAYIAQIAHTRLALERFDFEAAHAILDSVERHFDTIEHWPVALAASAELHILQGQPRMARTEIISTLRDRAGEHISAPAKAELFRIATLANLAIGDFRTAHHHLNSLPRDSPAAASARALLNLQYNRPDDALRAISPLRNRDDLSQKWTAIVLSLSCVALHDLGREQTLAVTLEELSATLGVSGVRTPLVFLPERSRQWLAGEVGVPIPPEATGLFPSSVTASPTLSRREEQVLAAMAVGYSREDIAAALHVSPNTVKTQVRSIYRKLSVNSREAALIQASEFGLIRALGEVVEGPPTATAG